jgi:hypothetical protein
MIFESHLDMCLLSQGHLLKADNKQSIESGSDLVETRSKEVQALQFQGQAFVLQQASRTCKYSSGAPA